MFDAESTDGNLGDNFQTQEMRRFPEGSKRGDGIQCFQLELFFTQNKFINAEYEWLIGGWIYFFLWQERTMTQTTAKNNLTKTEVLGTLSV